MVLISVLLAAVARALFLGGNSLWSDETFSILWSQQSLGYFLVAVGTQLEPSPPLYYVLLHEWMLVFGSSAGAVRSLSVVLSILSVLATYGIGHVLLGGRWRFCRNFRRARSGERVLRPGSARLFPSGVSGRDSDLGAGLLCARAVAIGRAPSWAWLIVFAVAVTAAAYTHYTALVFVTACFATHDLFTSSFPARERSETLGRCCSPEFSVLTRCWDRLCAVPGEIAGGLGGAVFDPALFALAGPGLSAFAADLSRHAVQPRGADRLRRAAACAGGRRRRRLSPPAAIRFADSASRSVPRLKRSPSASSARSCCRASACG